MPIRHSWAWLVIATLMAGSSFTTVHAQELNWRHNYAAARREAAESGKALLLDFGTESCVWCRKLDATTFRDPRIVKILSDRFIPVKIDAEREDRLTRALAIESFPTIVLASAEGKVLGRHEGYADVPQLTTLLAKVPSRPETSSIAAAAPVKTTREEGAARMEPALTSPPRAPAIPSQAPGDWLKAAQGDYDAGRYAESLARCLQVAANNPGEGDAEEARRLSQRISANPIAQQQIRTQLAVTLEQLQPKLAAALER